MGTAIRTQVVAMGDARTVVAHPATDEAVALAEELSSNELREFRHDNR